MSTEVWESYVATFEMAAGATDASVSFYRPDGSLLAELPATEGPAGTYLASVVTDTGGIHQATIEGTHPDTGATIVDALEFLVRDLAFERMISGGGGGGYAPAPPTTNPPPGGGTSVTDHGALTGLSDDDHGQYLTATRGDQRYYTKAQSDAITGPLVSSTELAAALTPYLKALPAEAVTADELAAALGGYLTTVPPEYVTAQELDAEIAADLAPYLQSVPAEYVTATELAAALAPYLTSVPPENVTEAELATALAPYLTGVPAEFVTADELAAALAPYLTAVPAHYVTESELAAALAPYLTAIPGEYLTESEGDGRYAPLPNLAALDALENPAGTRFVAGHTSAGDSGHGFWTFNPLSTKTPDRGLYRRPNGVAGSNPGRWEKVLVSAFVTPYDFGGRTADTATDATLAVQDCVDAMRASYHTGTDSWRIAVSGAGKSWLVSTVNATNFRQATAKIRDITLYCKTPGKIVLDMLGSARMEPHNLRIIGDEATPPAVGMLIGRSGEYDYLVSPQHVAMNVRTEGSFSRAALISFASEIISWVNCSFTNSHPSPTVPTAICTGHGGTIFDYAGAVQSEHAAIAPEAYQAAPATPSGNNGYHSNIAGDFQGTKFLRQAAFQLKIASISKANPAVLTVEDPAKLQAEIDAGRFNPNNQKLFFIDMGGMVELNGQVVSAGAVNAQAGTIALSGVDSTAYGTFTGGVVRNQSGPAVVVGPSTSFKVKGSYMLAWGNPSVVVDCKRVYSDGKPQEINDLSLDFKPEQGPPSFVRFDLPMSGEALVRNLDVSSMSANLAHAKALLDLGTGGGTGGIKVQKLRLNVLELTQAPPSFAFFQPSRWKIQDADISLPLEAAMNQNLSSFAFFSGRMYFHDTNRTRIYRNEAWTLLTSSSTPPLQNSWAPTASYEPPGYRLTSENVVQVKGSISGGTIANGTILWNFPVGRRPSTLRQFQGVMAGGGSCELLVSTNGNVTIQGVTANTRISLENIRFEVS